MLSIHRIVLNEKEELGEEDLFSTCAMSCRDLVSALPYAKSLIDVRMRYLSCVNDRKD